MLSILLLVLAVSTDAFLASLSYGSSRIKVPLISTIIISLTGAFFLGISICLSSFISEFIPPELCKTLSFCLLMTIGISGLFQKAIKAILKKCNSSKHFSFKLLDLKFLVEVYIDETKADIDKSKTISPTEALALGFALSADSLATGLSILSCINIPLTIILTFIMGIISIKGGAYLGNKINSKLKIDISWLNGIILILLAITKLV